MMKVKPFFNRIVVLLFAVSMLLPIKTHAQINNYFEDFMTEAKPSRKTATELFEEIKIANEKVTSVTENVSLYSTVETEDENTFSQQWALLDLLFDQDQAIKAAILYFESEENDQSYFEESFLPSDEKAVLVRSSENDEWVNQVEDSSEDLEYFANPNYHLLMDSLVNISDGLQVFEDENHYIFLNNGQDMNLFDEFQPHYDLYVTGIDSEDFTTDIMVSFDKETLLLTEFSYILYYDKNDEYLEISVNTIMEMWNEYHEDMFKKEIINNTPDLEQELEEIRDSMNLDDIKI
ncbi:hypothetical protein [Facklamia sp. 7083-14-GEN3]|uniref:hypothetical protein n=1 Tax=Facklamia sp. 7083-14-GEN3 TaxID=2973478 RepID=UPI00215CA438|nr:hypothetical protein [Facklamia sp. 7083-14-GEN3]MCR8969350.1 hypothetical protein [Facklamia sp. 7083-14-GEN3]